MTAIFRASLMTRRSPELFEALVAAAVVAVELVADRIAAVVVLVIILGRIELRRWNNLGGNRLPEPAGRLELAFACFGQAPLFGTRGEDRAAVLVADIAELAIDREWIDIAPEDLQQLRVTDQCRVVAHQHRLGMAGAAGRYLLISGIGDVATDIARRGRFHPRQLVERRFHAPETAAGEDRHGGLRSRLRSGRSCSCLSGGTDHHGKHQQATDRGDHAGHAMSKDDHDQLLKAGNGWPLGTNTSATP